MSARGRHGAVLVFVVLLMLSVVGLGHAVLVVSLAETAASLAAARHLTARAAAEAAVSSVLRTPAGTWLDSVQVGGARQVTTLSLGRAAAIGGVRRLAPEAWLVQGEGGIPGRPTERAARLAWSLDPLERVLALEGAITVLPGAQVVLAGTVDTSAPATAEPPLPAAECDPWGAALSAWYTRAALAPVASPPPADTLGAPHLGLLDFTTLAASAGPSDLVTPSSGSPAPVERFGSCVVDEAWGWGDPLEPWRPCGSHLPLRVAPADLVVVGGAAQGTLLVGGDLTLTGAARYFGLVVVRGTLRIENGSHLEGLAMARGGVDLSADSRVRASACWAVRALAASRASFGRLVAVPGVGAIGPR
jgi:hypothetical protein